MSSASGANQNESDTLTLTYRPIKESHHKYLESFVILENEINDKQELIFQPSKYAVLHTYLNIQAADEGLRVSSQLVESDLYEYQTNSFGQFPEADLQRKKANQALSSVTPDFYADDKGTFIRYDITDDYKTSLKMLMIDQVKQLRAVPKINWETESFIKTIETRIANIDRLTQSEFEPERTPSLPNYSVFNDIVLKTDSTGVELNVGGGKGTLSFIDTVNCTDLDDSKHCVLLKYRNNLEESTDASYSRLQSLTFLVVDPNTLKPFSIIKGSTTEYSSESYSGKLIDNALVTSFTYGDSTTSRINVDATDTINRLYKLLTNNIAELKEDPIALEREITYMHRSLKKCKEDRSRTRFKTKQLRGIEACNSLGEFYKNAEKMRFLSEIEDGYENAALSKSHEPLLDPINDLLDFRAGLLAAMKIESQVTDGQITDASSLKTLTIETMREVLESSPVTSQRHQVYKQKMITKLDAMFDSGADESLGPVRR